MPNHKRKPFVQGYAEGVEEGIAKQPRKAIIKAMNAVTERMPTKKRRGKLKKGYDKGKADAKSAIQDRQYLKGK
jgi:hypothetical protein